MRMHYSKAPALVFCAFIALLSGNAYAQPQADKTYADLLRASTAACDATHQTCIVACTTNEACATCEKDWFDCKAKALADIDAMRTAPPPPPPLPGGGGGVDSGGGGGTAGGGGGAKVACSGSGPCDDGLFCTTNDRCQGGFCVGDEVDAGMPTKWHGGVEVRDLETSILNLVGGALGVHGNTWRKNAGKGSKSWRDSDHLGVGIRTEVERTPFCCEAKKSIVTNTNVTIDGFVEVSAEVPLAGAKLGRFAKLGVFLDLAVTGTIGGTMEIDACEDTRHSSVHGGIEGTAGIHGKGKLGKLVEVSVGGETGVYGELTAEFGPDGKPVLIGEVGHNGLTAGFEIDSLLNRNKKGRLNGGSFGREWVILPPGKFGDPIQIPLPWPQGS